MRTTVYRLPHGELEALVTTYDDGHQTLALRPQHATWGPPISPKSDSDDLSATSDLEAFLASAVAVVPPTLPDELTPGEPEEAVVFDATIRRCPLCGADLVATWEGTLKRCPQPPVGCGAHLRNGLVSDGEGS